MRTLSLLGLASLALGACYAPELRDCTVTCTESTDCADDQVCDGDGFCAAPEIAGTCGTGSGSTVSKLSLRVTIDGPGAVEVVGVGTCTSDCTWMVDAGASVQLLALDGEKKFERWKTANCASQDTSCTLAMTASAIVIARFH
jgi:hypothetical protein